MKEYINKRRNHPKKIGKKISKSRMEEKTAMLIIGKLNECMEKDRLYLNPDLKLQDVAKVVKCNTGELSQVLNMFMNIGFTDYVNKYRIDEFIKEYRISLLPDIPWFLCRNNVVSVLVLLFSVRLRSLRECHLPNI